MKAGRPRGSRDIPPNPGRFLFRLYEARLRAGMTQKQAGALIGQSPSNFGKVERGEIGFKAQEALILCNRFKLTIQQLMETQE